jgi:hypothetical protein
MAGMMTIEMRPRMARLGENNKGVIVPSVCSVAVPGSTFRGTCARRAGTGTCQAPGTTTLGCVSPRTFNPLLFSLLPLVVLLRCRERSSLGRSQDFLRPRGSRRYRSLGRYSSRCVCGDRLRVPDVSIRVVHPILRQAPAPLLNRVGLLTFSHRSTGYNEKQYHNCSCTLAGIYPPKRKS